MNRLEDSAKRLLTAAALAYGAGTLIHSLDHARRGTDILTMHVLVGGTLGTVLACLAIGAAAFGHRLAPFLAASIGFPHAIGIASVHLLPRWSAFSDAFPGANVSWMSYVAVLSEVAGALAMGAAGLYAIRRTPQPQIV